VKIGNEGLLKILNRGINLVGADFAQSIAHRYTSELYTYTIKDIIMDHLALFVLLIMAIAALIIAFLVRDIRRSRRVIEEKESANRAKTAFLNNMSHDMRTPMNAIVGFTDLAAEHADDSEQVRSYLDMISVSSQHLLSLINDVLDMSRIESGNLNIEEENVDLKELIDDIRLITQTDAEAKNLDLSIDTEGIQHGNVVTDRLRLSQVLLNILSNAVKFTPDGGTIQFTAEERPSESEETAEYVFRIKDNGIGMSEEFRTTIFDAFTRERTTTVSGIQGTGLGMAITKSIIDKMGGSITVQSEEGKGSEFIVRVPFKVISVPESKATQTDAKEGEQQHDFTGKRVLLVEDNEMNRMIATAILEKTGVNIDIAENGQVAVDKVKAAEAGYYDIILMDIQMPVMDGYEATRQIRALEDPGKAKTPIVAVTANAFEEDRKITMAAGMDDHLSKPYEVPAIMKTMSKLITTKKDN
jgi:signal transduction histidine kinase/CheY-like chemotaxis protein